MLHRVLPVAMVVLLAGCTGARPPAVEQGHKLTRQAYLAVADGEKQVIETLITAYRSEAFARIDMAVDADVQEGVRRAGPTASTADTVAFVLRVQAARDAKRVEVDAKCTQLRQIVEKSRGNLLIAAKLEEVLDRYDNTGVDMSAATRAVDEILALLKR